MFKSRYGIAVQHLEMCDQVDGMILCIFRLGVDHDNLIREAD